MILWFLHRLQMLYFVTRGSEREVNVTLCTYLVPVTNQYLLCFCHSSFKSLWRRKKFPTKISLFFDILFKMMPILMPILYILYIWLFFFLGSKATCNQYFPHLLQVFAWHVLLVCMWKEFMLSVIYPSTVINNGVKWQEFKLL